MVLVLLCVAARPRPARAGDTSQESAQLQVVRDWQLFTTWDGLPDESIRALHRFGDQLWVGTDSGLALYENGCWRRWTATDGLPWPAIRAMDVDPATHDVWLGTWGGGLVRFSAGRFDRFDQINSGIASDLVFAVRVQGQRIWAATSSGLSVFDWVAKTWDLQLERRADAPETVATGLALSGAEMYAATWGEGLQRIEDSGPCTETEGLALDGAGFGLAEARGELFVTSASTLTSRTRDGSWSSEIIPGERFLPAWRCSVSESGETWLGSAGELLCRTQGARDAWVRYDFRANGADTRLCVSDLSALQPSGRITETLRLAVRIPVGRVRCIAAGENEVWVGTGRGLLCGRGHVTWNDARNETARADDLAGHEPTSARAPTMAESPEAVALEKDAQVWRLGLLCGFQRTVVLPGAHLGSFMGDRPDDYAAQLAAEAGQRGHAGAPHEAVEIARYLPGMKRYAWGTQDDEFIDVVRGYAPVALVGCIGPGQRVSAAVAANIEIPFVNTSLATPSADQRANPWLFHCPTDDPRLQAELLDYVFDELGCTRPVIVRTGDPDSDQHLDWWRDRAQQRRHPAVAELQMKRGGQDLSALVSSLQALDFDVLLTWSGEGRTAALVRQLRERGLQQLVVGSDTIVSAEFLRMVGGDPGSVVALQPCAHRLDQAGLVRFVVAYGAREPSSKEAGGPPPMACVTYDAVRHVIEAIERGGVEREPLRDALQEMGRLRIARALPGGWQLISGQQ